jgi:hypothetical protein
MSVRYAVLLKAVTLDSSSKIRVKEGATTSTLTVVDPATGAALASSKQFFLRGDGATDDLLRVLKETVSSHSGTNTYSTSLALSIDPASPSGVVTLTRVAGANSFQLLWSNAATTFDQGLLGFADSDTADNGSPKVSTLSPSALWVAPEVYEFLEPAQERAASVTRTTSGKVRGVKRGGAYDVRTMSHRFIDSRRVWESENTSDPDAAFNRFLDATADGTRFELHTVGVTGTTLGALSSSTRVGTAWHWSQEDVDGFDPERMNPGLALYAWQNKLLAYVA